MPLYNLNHLANPFLSEDTSTLSRPWPPLGGPAIPFLAFAVSTLLTNHLNFAEQNFPNRGRVRMGRFDIYSKSSLRLISSSFVNQAALPLPRIYQAMLWGQAAEAL